MKQPAGRATALERKTEQALLHFEIGLRCFNARLPVDWQYVAYKMAATLGDWPDAAWPRDDLAGARHVRNGRHPEGLEEAR